MDYRPCGICSILRGRLQIIALAMLVAASSLGIVSVGSAWAQSSSCLSDLRVNAELLGYVRSVMKSAALDSAARLKVDSAFISQSDSLCAVAVRAYNAISGGTRTALYVVVVPGLTYAAMPATPDDKLVTLAWFSRRWTDPIAMEP